MKNFIIICFALVALFAAVQSIPLEELFEDTFQDEPTDLYQGIHNKKYFILSGKL